MNIQDPGISNAERALLGLPFLVRIIKPSVTNSKARGDIGILVTDDRYKWCILPKGARHHHVLTNNFYNMAICVDEYEVLP